MISRYSGRLLCLCIGVTLTATSVQAQTSGRSPKEVGEIISAALQAIIPPGKRLSDRTVAERGTRFDYARTMAAFGLADNAKTRASLGLIRAFTAGTDSLLVDCDQMGSKPCSRLGSSVYVYVEPIFMSDSEASVWVHVVWATTMPSKRTFKSASSTEVIFSRSGSGPWTFVRMGRGIIS